MDCPDTCSLDIEVKQGRVHEIRGSHANPNTQGFICSKVANFTQRLYSPDRLLHPMKRTGIKGSGEFLAISWEEAAKIITERFRMIIAKHGGEAILPFFYGGSNALLGQETSDKAFFAKLGACRLARTVCAAPTGAAALGMYGKMPGTAFEDYEYAKCILIWGANPKASNIHLVPYLKNAKAKGAKIVVIDPKLNFSHREYDLHLPVFPGTDLVLALAMIRFWEKNGNLDRQFIEKHTKSVEILLERASEYSLEKAEKITRVPMRDIEKLATMYAESSPAVIRIGWGSERNRNGGQATAAMLAIPALLGKFGVRGGGYTLSNGTAAKVQSEKIVDSPAWNTREINMNLLGRQLLEEKNPPIMALFVYNCNPAVTMPNQELVLKGLSREDLFTVVFDQVMTDTARYADVLLPAVTFLEQQEIKKAYGSYVLQYISPAISPCGESRPNEEVFAMLGREMGFTEPAFQDGTEQYLNRVANSIKGLGYPITLDALRADRILKFDFPGPTPIQFANVMPWTPDGKIDFAPEALGDAPYRYIEDVVFDRYPLALISPATSKTISSMMGEYNLPVLYATMHPKDAKERSLQDGATVKVFNEYGEVHCKLRIKEHIREGVVIIPKGAWRKSSLNGRTACALSPDTLGTAGGACFNDARVQVSAI
jgi:anaerobic selenocysteine-containing dehydrogenase